MKKDLFGDSKFDGLEDKIYEYGHVMYRIGRMETDGKDTGKEYNRMLKEKEKLVEFFNELFQTSIKFKG